jgi:DNA-binding phage protein
MAGSRITLRSALPVTYHAPFDSESLHRMLSASGNSTLENLSAIYAAITKALRVRTEITVTAVWHSKGRLYG